MFDDATVKEYYDELRNRTMLMLDAIINGDTEDKRAEIDKITTMLLLYNRPVVFSGSDNMEIQYDKQFGKYVFNHIPTFTRTGAKEIHRFRVLQRI